jgi:hypothetical protein
MAISRFSTSRLTQGLPKYQSAWDQDGVQQGALVPIGQAVSTGASGILGFASVPQGYRDLKVIVNGRSTHGSQTSFSIYLNNTGYVGWSMTRFIANNTTITTDRLTSSSPTYGLILETAWTNTSAGVFNAAEIDILNYSSSSTYKSVFGRNSFEQGTTGINETVVGTWANNAAVTYVEVATNGNWVGGSTATLYGVKAGV